MSIHQTSLLKLEPLMSLVNGVSLQAIYSKQTATNNIWYSIGTSFLSNQQGPLLLVPQNHVNMNCKSLKYYQRKWQK